jgi:hypothetical protein
MLGSKSDCSPVKRGWVEAEWEVGGSEAMVGVYSMYY